MPRDRFGASNTGPFASRTCHRDTKASKKVITVTRFVEQEQYLYKNRMDDIMTRDKEIVKSKIRELASKIKGEEEVWLWESYELEIAVLIIDYSIRHNIVIPLIDYDLYSRRHEENENEEEEEKLRQDIIKGRIKRKTIQEIERENKVDPCDYNYFEPFLEAIGEESLTNPRFRIHPEIRELVDCRNVE